MSIDQDRAIDLDRRWRRARMAALSKAAGRPVDAETDDEAWLVRLCASAAPEALHRAVYDNGRKLGAGFVRFHGAPVAEADLEGLLSALQSPCLRGELKAASDGWVLDRAGCEEAEAGLCDYWREAAAGLLHGLTEGLHFTRHTCAAKTPGPCRDALYRDPEGPLRFAPLSEGEATALEAASVALRLLVPGERLVFLGALEGEIHYRRAGGRNGCAADEAAAEVEAVLVRFLPGARFRDASPRAVLAPDEATH